MLVFVLRVASSEGSEDTEPRAAGRGPVTASRGTGRGMRRLLTPAVLVLVAAALVVLTGLGVWQLVRHEGKQQLTREREATIAAPPIAAAEAATLDGESIEYRRVALEGEWDYERTQIVANRTRFGLRRRGRLRTAADRRGHARAARAPRLVPSRRARTRARGPRCERAAGGARPARTKRRREPERGRRLDALRPRLDRRGAALPSRAAARDRRGSGSSSSRGRRRTSCR